LEDIRVYLEDLENRIDENVEDALTNDWITFCEDKLGSGYFLPKRRKTSPGSVKWVKMLSNDALADYDNMIYHQLHRCNDQLESGGGELLCFRSDYGTGILPSLFGAEIFVMPYEQDSLPGVKHLENAKEILEGMMASGKLPDVKSGYALKTFEAAEHLVNRLKDYPKISKYVHIYMPDTESPISVAEAILGNDLYYMFFDEPDFVKDLLKYITDVFLVYSKVWHREFPPFSDKYRIDWGLLHKGHTLIRNDAAVNISGDLYEEFVAPNDARILKEMDGGIVHFCGRGDHFIDRLVKLNGLYGINMSQPDWNNMENIYQNTIDKGLEILGMPTPEVRRATAAGRELHGRVHCGASIAAWIADPKDR
jgi:hypothetical protein